MLQDYVMFIPPPPHYRGKPSDFSPSINECWYGRVNLIFKMRVRTDAGRVMECQCALIETLYNFRPTKSKSWWPSTAQVGTKLLYLPSPELVVCPLFQRVILAPFPVTCMDARKQATHWACATGLASLALAAPCSTSTPGP